MTTLDRIAFSLGRRDDVPNQELARELAENTDIEGIHEIAEHLWDSNPKIQSDCIKVLYEVGYISPALIADYYSDFLKLLKHRNNRLVWGAMIALSTIANIRADELFQKFDRIKSAIGEGSVITTDMGIKTLALIASIKAEYCAEIFPYLLEHLKTCRLKDVPQHAEHVLAAVKTENQAAYESALMDRMQDLSSPGLARIKKIFTKLKT